LVIKKALTKENGEHTMLLLEHLKLKRKEKEMPKKAVVKKKTSQVTIKNVDSKRKELESIQPKGKEGTVIFSVQYDDFCISLPVPLPEAISNTLKRGKTKSRTVVDSDTIKMGLDII
jgi:hypothetical protein